MENKAINEIINKKPNKISIREIMNKRLEETKAKRIDRWPELWEVIKKNNKYNI